MSYDEGVLYGDRVLLQCEYGMLRRGRMLLAEGMEKRCHGEEQCRGKICHNDEQCMSREGNDMSWRGAMSRGEDDVSL